MQYTFVVSTAIAALICGTVPAFTAEPIGAAAKVEATLTGPNGELVTGAAVYFNDKLKTDATGVGQIVFKDDTKLAIGPNAEVTIDKFVYNDDGSFKELAVGMTKGTFRWISGKSKPEAYKLSTGWANLAIRGTAFDLNVDPEAGQLTLVLYEGEVDLCLLNGDCRKIAGKCRYIVSETRVEVKDPEALPRSRALQLKKTGLIPFIDNERLIEPFHLKNASCKVRKVQKQRKAQRTNRSRQASAKPAATTVAVAVTTARDVSISRTGDTSPPSTPDPGPTPSAEPGAIDSTPDTVEGPGPVPSRPTKTGKRGHRGHGHGYGHGTGNPGNHSDNGNAGETPGGGEYGDGEHGKGDTHGYGRDHSGRGGNSGKGSGGN